MNYSTTQGGHVIMLISALVVIFGGKPFTPEESNALILVFGMLGQLVGWLVAWWGRYRKGDVNIIGFKKE